MEIKSEDQEALGNILLHKKQLWPADHAREEHTTPGGGGDSELNTGPEITFDVDGGKASVRT